MHSTSFRMSVSIIVILGVFCKAHFKSLRMHDTTENLPLAALYERMTIKSFLPDHKIFIFSAKATSSCSVMTLSPSLCSGQFGLARIQLIISAFLFDQLIMCTSLDDSSLLQYHNAVGIADR